MAASSLAGLSFVTDPELTEDQRRAAASQDLNILAVMMLVGGLGFALANLAIGTFGWIAAALSIVSTATWASGLWQRSSPVTAFVKIGFGFGGLAAPLVGLVGVVVGIAGYAWGWAVVVAAVLYLGFSVLGLAIIERAEAAGVVETFTSRLD